MHHVPVSDWTMEKHGGKRIEIAGIDDKRQLTGVFACLMTADFLPPNWCIRESMQIVVHHSMSHTNMHYSCYFN